MMEEGIEFLPDLIRGVGETPFSVIPAEAGIQKIQKA
jgi:hypothetical protein